ncbi:branched-chain amino acid transport system ATP-binding protein/neutral amino acid transport system ATP-binding protein [Bosea sp. CRIB-10]|uniref:ABC transporter ATP-binding protein n=1 Tax=Bosea sp. CRIB-10 TaxID=378404 RepID=UPI0008E03999|nr:ABC transporter ATP-binding protein [Bosea sp. CRIB-10]SFB77597.1 branched-chain amino acid transport system ATP-binding protein/neutral amino acid transport system ATP-binding protein [Bosea sp. CRIB-10]
MTDLTVRGLRGGYPNAEDIVKGIDLDVRAGDLTVIIGPNGAGKSTFLKLVAGLLTPTSGEISLQGKALQPGNAQAACKSGMSFVPQERNVFASLTIRENLEMGGYLHRRGLKDRVDEQLSRFPLLKTKLRDKAGNLSGGQRQVLAMGVALMTSPSVLLLDEPTAGLSPAAADEVFELVRDLAKSGLAVLMVEQNALLALEYGTKGLALVAGRKAREGTASSLLADDEVRHLFLGRRDHGQGATQKTEQGDRHEQV